MAITTSLCDTAKVGFLSGAFQASDTYALALYTSAATLGSSTTAYTSTNEVADGNGYTTGGQTLVGITYDLTNGTGSIDWGNASWAASTITARGALLYRVGNGNPAIATFDFGQDVSSFSGTFTVSIPATGTGVIRIS